MTPTRQQLTEGTLLLTLLVLIWGAFLPVSKVVLAFIDPVWFTLLRFGSAALIFAALLAWREGPAALRPGPLGLRIFVFGSAGFACFGLLVFEGLRLTRPEQGAMILALSPVHIALFQWWRSRRRPPTLTLAAIAVALIGEALVLSHGELSRLTQGDALGNGLLFLASLFWVGYTLGGQRFPGWSPLRYTALSCLCGSVTLAAATLLATASGHSAPPPPAVLLQLWPHLLFVILAVSVGAMLIWSIGVAKIGALNAGLFSNFTPVVTYAIALGQGRAPAAIELAGAALVLGALIANNLHQRWRLRSSPLP